MDETRFQLSRGDALAWLRTLRDESVDLVVTDPPYESLEKHRAIGTTTRLKHSKASSNDWFEIFPNDRFEELFVEVHRVLKRNTHFYLYCDPETMFVAKPIAEKVGFKFWKPLVWDKCLGPDTLVWTQRGATRIAEVVVGDNVAIPEGGVASVRATRATRRRALRLHLSDGTDLVASHEHRLVRADGVQVEAATLAVGDALCTRPVRARRTEVLGLESKLGPRALQNDEAVWHPRTLPLDFELGKLIGLYAAAGGKQGSCGVTFAFHADETHLHAHVARFMRRLGIGTHLLVDGNRAIVRADFKLAEHLVDHFVGGGDARTRYLKCSVYEANDELRRGVVAGLLEGDGHWSHAEQRDTYASASPDLAHFVHRELRRCGQGSSLRRFENDHGGGWEVRSDPASRVEPLTVTAIDDLGETGLIDISIDHPDELFLLANGVVTHNCKIGMGYHYRARYECILFFEKGKRKLSDLGQADIIQHPRISGGYPAEKPPQVSRVLIEQSTLPGELVIDPFMGSGSVGVAATSLGRSFLGNDLCAEAVQIARDRLLANGAVERAVEPKPEEPVAQLGLSM